MGRTVDPNKFSKARPKIEVGDIEEGDFAVATVAKYDEVAQDFQGERRITPALTFREFGDKVLWLNKTQMQYLVERLGNDADKWTGKRVPLVKKRVMFGDEAHEKVYVATPEEWDDLLTAAEPAPVRKPTKSAKRGR